MANAENPLLSLSSEKQQQIVDLVDNGDIADIADKGGMTRRQVLQVAVALGAGATAGGYSVDQIIGEARAAADTADSDGNVGLPGDRVDVFAEGVDVSGEVGATSVSTEEIGTGWYYAESFPGSDPDARLDSALSAASDRDVIYLETDNYTTDRTITKRVKIQGKNLSKIDANWTLNSARITITDVSIIGDWTISAGPHVHITDSELGGAYSITVSSDEAVLTEIKSFEGTVTFESGTANGIIDGCTRISVTDAGTNTVGDIS